MELDKKDGQNYLAEIPFNIRNFHKFKISAKKIDNLLDPGPNGPYAKGTLWNAGKNPAIVYLDCFPIQEVNRPEGKWYIHIANNPFYWHFETYEVFSDDFEAIEKTLYRFSELMMWIDDCTASRLFHRQQFGSVKRRHIRRTVSGR